MPNLLIFVASQQAILSMEDGAASIIGIMRGLTFPIPPEMEVPADAAVKMRWYAFSMWEREGGDETKAFEQQVRLMLPDGRPFSEAITSFQFGPSETWRNIVTFAAFPAYPPGRCDLELSLREQGAETWQECAHYPLVITHVPAKAE